MIHLLFLYFIITEEKNHILASTLTMLITLLISVGYLYLFQKNKKLKFKDAYLIIAVVFGALSTAFLNIEMQLGAVISSAAVGVLGSFFPENFPTKKKGTSIRTAIYCGSFIGMGSILVNNHYLFIAFAGLISGIYFCITSNWLNGFGGKLGTLAFVGVAVAYFLTYIFFN